MAWFKIETREAGSKFKYAKADGMGNVVLFDGTALIGNASKADARRRFKLGEKCSVNQQSKLECKFGYALCSAVRSW